jgi:hypothetical protein
MTNRDFTIEEYRKGAKAITVTIYKETEPDYLYAEIDRDHFEQWLVDSGALEWSDMIQVEPNVWEEISGKISIEDYWKEFDTQYRDIHDYITTFKHHYEHI